MYISDVRKRLVKTVRSASDPTAYDDFSKDFAHKTAAEEIIRRCDLLLRVDAITLLANSNTLPTLPTGFRPDRLVMAYLTGTNVQVNDWGLSPEAPYLSIGAPHNSPWRPDTCRLKLVDLETLLNLTDAAPFKGQPVQLCFDTLTTGLTYPERDQAYTANLRWNDFYTTWTDGSPLALATIAEVDTFTPANPTTSDVYTITITYPNLTTHAVGATVGVTQTPTAIVTLLKAAWAADPIAAAYATASGTATLILTSTTSGTVMNLTGSVVGTGTISKVAVNSVTSVAVTSTGAFDGSTQYGSAPTVTAVGGTTGTAATFTSTIDGNGRLNGIAVAGGGTLYTAAPDIYVNGVLCTDQVLKLPDDILLALCQYGAPSKVQFNEPENVELAKNDAAKWEEFITSMLGRMDLGVKEFVGSGRR